MARTNTQIKIKTKHIGPLGQWVSKVWDYLANHVQEGLEIGAPTTASGHADAGAFDFNVDIAAGWVNVDGVLTQFAAQADFDVDNGTPSPIDATDVDITYTIVAKNVSGTITCAAVAGAAAASGLSVEPTDAVITAAVGSLWIKLGTTVATRTGAATMTQVYANTGRPVIGWR